MSLKWYEVEDIVGREATTTRQKAENVLADLQRRQQLRREQEEAEALESREAREKLSANWLLSQQRVRAADDIEVANKALSQLGWTDLIPISESSVSSQIMSGGSWANSIIKQVKVATQQARLDDVKKEAKEWAQWSVRQGDGTWANLSPTQQAQMINQWTDTLLAQRYPEEYGALAVAEPTEIPSMTPEIPVAATRTTPEMQIPTAPEPKTEIPEGGVYIAEGIKVMPDYTVYSDDDPSKAMGRIDPQTGKFEEVKPGALQWIKGVLSQIWKGIPLNPYYWMSPQEQQLADYKNQLMQWAETQGIENPKEYVENLLEKPSGELTIGAVSEEELAERKKVPGMPPSYLYNPPEGITKGEQFIGEWVMPMMLLALLPSAGAARTALEAPAKAGGVIGAAAKVGRVALKPVEIYEQGISALMRLPAKALSAGTQKALQAYINNNARYIRLIATQRAYTSLSAKEKILYKIFNLHNRYMTMQAADVLKAQHAALRATTTAARQTTQTEIRLLNAGIESSIQTMGNIVAATQAGTELTTTSIIGLIAKNTPTEFVSEITAIIAGEAGVGVARAVAGVPVGEAVIPEYAPTTAMAEGGEVTGEVPAGEVVISEAAEAITPPVTPEIAQLRIQPISQLSTEDIKTLGVRALASKISKLKIKEKNLPLEYKTQINSILANFDAKFRTNRTLGKRQAIKDYVNMLEETDGIVANVPEELIELANRTPLRDMTTEQLQMLHDEIAKLVHLGALKNKLIKVQAGRRVDEAVKELVGQLGGAKEPPIYTKETKETALLSKSPISESYLNRAYRIERIFLQEDGYVEGGLFQTTFYKPINDARNQVLREDYTFLEESHRPFLKENNLDISKLIGKSEEVVPGIKLALSEKMGVYLNSLNEDNLLHLKYGNKFSDELIRTVVDSLTPEQKAYAKFLQSHVASQGVEVSKVMTQIAGRGLDLVEDYWPIVLDQEALPEMNFEKALAQEQGLRFAAKWASSRIPKSFTKARTHKAMQPVNLDALAVFNKHTQRVYHYKAYAPIIRDLQLIINNPKFKKAFILNEGKARYQVLDKWVKQNAEINPLAVRSEAERWFRIARTRSIAAITGINLTMSLRQFPSWFTGMAELGELPTIKGLAQVIKDYKGTRALIREYDPQTYRRSWAWEIGEKAMARKVMGKLSPQEVFSILVRTADKFTVTSLWRGAFDEYLRKNPGMFKEAGEEAARLIRRTQPMFEVKDLAEIYRSGEFMKVVVAWTNQLNQNLNYYRFDIAGKYGAGKIGTGTLIRRIIEAFVIPGLIIGWSIRSRPAKNAKEFVEDMATQATGAIPVVGSYLASILKGYTADVDLMTFAALEKAQRILAQMYRGDWEKALQTSPELAGYLVGLPTVQTKRFIQGILDLASGETDDWARLIWGGYTREKYMEEDGKISTDALNEVSKLFYEKNFDELSKGEQEIVLAVFES